MLKKITNSMFVSALVLGFAAQGFAQNTKSLSDLQGLESSRDRSNSPSQVVILNNSPSTTQDQNSRIEARAGWGNGDSLEYLRNHRMRKEAQNEQALMEKLEESRVDDERSRLERLFRIREYNRQQNNYNDGVVVINPDVQVNKPVVVNPDGSHGGHHPPHHPPHRPEKPGSGGLLNWWKLDKKHDFYTQNRRWYIGGQFGLADYGAYNAKNSSTWGLSIGKNFDRKIHLEFNFMSSNYTIDDPRGNYEVDYWGNLYIEPNDLRDLSQYNYSGILGYNIVRNRNFRMSLRGGLSYVQRDSQSSEINGFSRVSTDAVDLAVGARAELELSNKLYAVSTFDYFTNLTNDVFEDSGRYADRVEISDYYVWGLGLRYEF